jgi:hypothetical protein
MPNFPRAWWRNLILLCPLKFLRFSPLSFASSHRRYYPQNGFKTATPSPICTIRFIHGRSGLSIYGKFPSVIGCRQGKWYAEFVTPQTIKFSVPSSTEVNFLVSAPCFSTTMTLYIELVYKFAPNGKYLVHKYRVRKLEASSPILTTY